MDELSILKENIFSDLQAMQRRRQEQEKRDLDKPENPAKPKRPLSRLERQMLKQQQLEVLCMEKLCEALARVEILDLASKEFLDFRKMFITMDVLLDARRCNIECSDKIYQLAFGIDSANFEVKEPK